MIRINRKIVAINSLTLEVIDPSYLGFTEDKIKKYISEHPMPKDEAYSEEDLIHDLTKSSGAYILPWEVKDETIEYVENLLNSLIW